MTAALRSSDRFFARFASAFLATGIVVSGAYMLMPTVDGANIVYYSVSSLVLAFGWGGILRGAFPGRWMVALLLSGASIWLASDWLWWMFELTGRSVPFPSPLDLLYLTGYPLGLVALVSLWRRHMTAAFGGLLDSAIFASSFGIFVWAVAIAPGGENEFGLLTITALAYPTLDAMLLIGFAQLVTLPAFRRSPSVHALTLGIAFFLASDVLYAFDSLRDTYVEGTWRDLGWLLAYVLWGFAAAHPSVRALGEPRLNSAHRWAFRVSALALVCMSIPIAALIAAERDVSNRSVFIAAVACFVIVAFTVRMGMILRSQERTEEALAETIEKLQTLIEAAPLAIAAVDRTRRITIWNPGAERLFGWRASEVVGKVNPLTQGEEGSRNLEQVFAGESFQIEALRPRRDGSTAEVFISAAPLRSRTDEVIGAVALFLDVRERKLLEESLRHSQRLETVGQLAGGVAHDFNNLLTAILGYCSLSLDRAKDDSELAQNLAEIARASERASELTRQLLAFGRRQVLQPSTFDLNEAVIEIDSILARLLGENIHITHALDSSGCPIRADQGQIEQVLMNLGVNARDAMPDGGTLTFMTENVEISESEAEPLGLEAGRYARLYVADSGMGMDEETRSRVFEPFFTTKEVGKGSGLGLATVYGIISQSGGHIGVESESGTGTTFVIHLPSAELGTRGAAEHVESEDGEKGGSERILLVEDEDGVRDITRQMLERSGYEVVVAGDSAQALDIASRTDIDVLVTDLTLPDTDGQALAARFRGRRPGLPVIFVSGYSHDENDFGSGFFFLQKPYSSDDLSSAVRGALDSRS